MSGVMYCGSRAEKRLAGARIEQRHALHCARHLVEADLAGARDGSEVAALHQRQVAVDDLLQGGILEGQVAALQSQTLAQIARPDAWGVELLQLGEGRLDLLLALV